MRKPALWFSQKVHDMCGQYEDACLDFKPHDDGDWQPLYTEPQLTIIGWLYEDELPSDYPYTVMFKYSKVDIVRLFPVFAPSEVLED